MSVFGQRKPTFLKTYGKQKRRVEQWISPDLRKKAFSFSSTPSSDQSIPELNSKKRSRIRLAKQKAMEALRDPESDESNFLPETAFRRKPNNKIIKKAAVPSKTPGVPGFTASMEEHDSQYKMRIRKKRAVFSSSENESDCFVTENKRLNAPRQRKTSKIQHTNCGIPPFSNGMTNPKQCLIQQESDTKHPIVFPHVDRSGRVLREVSFNDLEERTMSCKHPLLCSTPSLVSKQIQHCLEPSLSEISSFICDELDKPSPPPPHLNESSANYLRSKPCKPRMRQRSDMQVKDSPKTEAEQQIEEHANAQSMSRKHETCSSSEFVSARPHLKQLKQRAVVMLEELEVLDMVSNQSDNRKQEDNKIYSPGSDVGLAASANAIPSCLGKRNRHLSSDYACSSRETTSCNPSSFSSACPLSAPQTSELSNSLHEQIDRLKVECLSSCLTVSLKHLDLNTIPKAQIKITETPKDLQVASPVCSGAKIGQNSSNSKNCASLLDTQSAEQSSCSEFQTGGLVRQLAGSFVLSAIPPATVTAPSKMPAAKENASLCTSRKVCVSGLNASRWSKRGMSEQKRNQRHKETRTKPGEFSSSNLLPTGADSYIGEPACSWLQSSRVMGLPKTPIKLLNLSSFLTSFTPESLTTHNWGRLKAALSIHKRKTAFKTPQRLAQGMMDTSLELFGTPRSYKASTHLLLSSMNNTSMISCNEDISDAEKVYQECQQEGPISFDDCLAPEAMKQCIKIGEGTFGEVFSIVNDAKQTVALKIIPIEGSQKVNDEAQKTFGEVLHEIIISKELSALNSKEYNKTSGFIGLINLHCVRGCYPITLLKAWDKFDKEKGSENDRPDFFGAEQLFLILEFEFGGSDLENMNGKLASMAQAKSVLHQVTAALAVAEEALCFEHRDLHWGNILVKNTKEKHNQFILNGSVHSIETRGVHVNVIDYSLSRLEIDGLTVSCDIANEEELFMGQGDYQFEIYRLMKKENNNCWTDYNPHSNVLWLHYLADKLLTMRYRNKQQSSQQRALKSSLKSFHSEVLNFQSAKDVLMQSTLFQ
ncbi:serine/threonine-protein kinase haspin isoform X2, partial [Silurus asotus]